MLALISCFNVIDFCIDCMTLCEQGRLLSSLGLNCMSHIRLHMCLHLEAWHIFRAIWFWA